MRHKDEPQHGCFISFSKYDCSSRCFVELLLMYNLIVYGDFLLSNVWVLPSAFLYYFPFLSSSVKMSLVLCRVWSAYWISIYFFSFLFSFQKLCEKFRNLEIASDQSYWWSSGKWGKFMWASLVYAYENYFISFELSELCPFQILAC